MFWLFFWISVITTFFMMLGIIAEYIVDAFSKAQGTYPKYGGTFQMEPRSYHDLVVVLLWILAIIWLYLKIF